MRPMAPAASAMPVPALPAVRRRAETLVIEDPQAQAQALICTAGALRIAHDHTLTDAPVESLAL